MIKLLRGRYMVRFMVTLGILTSASMFGVFDMIDDVSEGLLGSGAESISSDKSDTKDHPEDFCLITHTLEGDDWSVVPDKEEPVRYIRCLFQELSHESINRYENNSDDDQFSIESDTLSISMHSPAIHSMDDGYDSSDEDDQRASSSCTSSCTSSQLASSPEPSRLKRITRFVSTVRNSIEWLQEGFKEGSPDMNIWHVYHCM